VRRGTDDRARGFTLPEVIMAVAILGIIAASIGAIITAAFSSTTGVRERYDASRAAKQASLYWTPDVQSAEAVDPGAICGAGDGAAPRALITFRRTDYAEPTTPEGEGTERLTTWWLDDTDPARVVRRSCAGADVERTVITSRIATSAGELARGSAEAVGRVTVADCADPCAAPTLVAQVADKPASNRAPGRFGVYRFTITANREVR
jgi:prepilin-type N-terminal cleavage/methylation domain-containing protein